MGANQASTERARTVPGAVVGRVALALTAIVLTAAIVQMATGSGSRRGGPAPASSMEAGMNAPEDGAWLAESRTDALVGLLTFAVGVLVLLAAIGLIGLAGWLTGLAGATAL